MDIHFNKNKKFNLLTIYILIGLALHLVSVYFSTGFFSDDEHFQILEPTAYLLGLNKVIIDDPTGYYWEWESWVRMRPWLQSYIYYHFINILKIIGIGDPFSWVFFIRLFSSLFGFASIVYFFSIVKDDFFKKNNNFNYLLFFTFWFYPFLHSRTSSENLSITLFIFSFCFLYKKIKTKEIQKNYFAIFNFSLLIGLALVTKFNLIFTVIPFFLWILLFRFNFYNLLLMSLAVICGLLIGLYVDYINWGSFENTYYQYYKHNIITGTLNVFGVEPWWYYISSTIVQLAPVLSIFFVLSLFLYWLKFPKSVYTWITLFTVISFSFFGHKEIRYIFIIYLFAPLFISFFFETFPQIKFGIYLKTLIIISNIVFLMLTLFSPANIKVGVYEFLYKNYKKGEEVYYIKNNPYLVNNMEPFFYTSYLPKIKEIKLENIKKNYIYKNSWIITNDFKKYEELKNNKKCIKEYSTYPEKIVNLNNNWKKLKLNWFIVYCNTK